MPHQRKISILLASLLAGTVTLPAGAEQSLHIGAFSSGDPERIFSEWQPYRFKSIRQHTQYDLLNTEGQYVVRAKSNASASGLIKTVSIDITKYPILSWRWKVIRKPDSQSDHRRQDDDHAARLYLIFNSPHPQESRWSWLWRQLHGKKAQQTHAINYIWANGGTVGQVQENPYSSSAMMISVNSGTKEIGRWVEHRRDLREDYRISFGQLPPLVSAIAIMTDSDNSQSEAIAYYGDILFSTE